MLDEAEAEIANLEETSSQVRPRKVLRRTPVAVPGVRVVAVRADAAAALRRHDGTDAAAWVAVADGANQLEALRAGAAGVVSGNASSDEVAAAVSAVEAGLAVVPVSLLRDLVPLDDADRAVPIGPALTPREVSVLQLLSEGATNKMIARRLDISVHTAKFHVASILDKLDATTRTDAVAQGVRQGVLML